jgi:hypothetical protein
LSRSEDKVGSQLAIVIEQFNGTPLTPTEYSLANTQVSDVLGIPTKRYTFLKPSILSKTEDKVGSQKAIVIEAFGEIPLEPAGYVIANTQESNVEGIPTTRYTFLKPSILSETTDNVGSQKARVIEAFSEVPETPTGYSLASTQVSDFEGIETNRYTFLKPSILSQSKDKVGSQLAITIEAFGLVPSTPDSYVLANEQVSDVEGIKTTRYTFLKPSILNETEDKVGSQNSIVIEAFGLTPITPASYVLANTQVSDVAGVPTKRYTFLKEDVELSRSEDKIGSQLAIVIEQFDGIPATPAGYSIASTQVSDIGGIPTKRYTFLKPSILSQSEDKVGSQLAVIVEAFNEIPATPVNYVIANKQVSDFEGIPTTRYTFLKPSVLSQSTDKVGSQLAITIESFSEVPATPSGYSIANEQTSDVGGIPTMRYTFLKAGILSQSNDYVGSQLAENIEVFSPTVEPTPTNGAAVLGNKSTSNVGGIPTVRYTFLVPSVLSESSDKVGSQLAITVEAFNKTPATPTGYVVASKQTSDVEGIPTTRYTFLKPSILSRSDDKIGSQLAITIEAFGKVPLTPTDYVVANEQASDFEGIPTVRYTFLRPSILSQSKDMVGSQLAITIEAFSEVPVAPAGYVLANEQVSNFEGIKTNRYTYLKPSVLSKTEDKVGSQVSIVIEAFDITPSTPVSYVLARTQISDFDGISTKRYTFLKKDVELSRSEDKVGSQRATVIEQFDGIPETPAGYSIANTQESDVEGIPTKRYTFLKPSVLSRTEINDGSRMAIIIEAFEEVPSSIIGYALTNTQVSDVEGIPTNRYTFLKSGLLSESFQTLSDGLTKKSYTWLGTTDARDGVLVKETIGNYQGLQTITQEYMVLPSGFGGKFDYVSTVPFTIPGIVSTVKQDIGGGKNLILKTTPPVQTTCVATVDVSYSTNGSPSTSGLYQPDSWATAIVSGIGYNYRPISYTNSMSNYIREGIGDTIIRTQAEGPAAPPQALMGQFLYINVTGRIELTGPTADPAGTTQLLSVSVDPAFTNNTGSQYYKITKVTAQIPARG